MTAHSANLQAAIFTLLRDAVPPIADRRVYDAPPDATPDDVFPHVIIGEGDSLPDDTLEGDEGLIETVNLHIWSRHAGKLEAKLIAGRIHDLLHEASLDVEGRASAHAFVRRTTIFDDPDGKTRHGVVTVEIIHRSYGD